MKILNKREVLCFHRTSF